MFQITNIIWCFIFPWPPARKIRYNKTIVQIFDCWHFVFFNRSVVFLGLRIHDKDLRSWPLSRRNRCGELRSLVEGSASTLAWYLYAASLYYKCLKKPFVFTSKTMSWDQERRRVLSTSQQNNQRWPCYKFVAKPSPIVMAVILNYKYGSQKFKQLDYIHSIVHIQLKNPS